MNEYRFVFVKKKITLDNCHQGSRPIRIENVALKNTLMRC